MEIHYGDRLLNADNLAWFVRAVAPGCAIILGPDDYPLEDACPLQYLCIIHPDELVKPDAVWRKA